MPKYINLYEMELRELIKKSGCSMRILFIRFIPGSLGKSVPVSYQEEILP